jgi:hypothetical protein
MDRSWANRDGHRRRKTDKAATDPMDTGPASPS